MQDEWLKLLNSIFKKITLATGPWKTTNENNRVFREWPAYPKCALEINPSKLAQNWVAEEIRVKGKAQANA